MDTVEADVTRGMKELFALLAASEDNTFLELFFSAINLHSWLLRYGVVPFA